MEHTLERLVTTDPPTTNRGVRNQVSALLDWISVTFKNGAKVSYPPECSRECAECRPLNGYNLAVRYADGRIELSHTTRADMGTHVIMSGGTLRMLPVSAENMLKTAVESGARVTRLDIAIDCRNCNLRPSEATERVKNGSVITKARKFPVWFDAQGSGHTQYIGKKASTAFARIYDKAAELGTDEDYARVELSFGGKRAMDAAQRCLRGESYLGMVRGFVDFNEWPEWGAVMSASPVATINPRVDTNTKRWLLSCSATSLAREMYYDCDHAFYFRFMDAVKFHLDKLESGDEKPI